MAAVSYLYLHKFLSEACLKPDIFIIQDTGFAFSHAKLCILVFVFPIVRNILPLFLPLQKPSKTQRLLARLEEESINSFIIRQTVATWMIDYASSAACFVEGDLYIAKGGRWRLIWYHSAICVLVPWLGEEERTRNGAETERERIGGGTETEQKESGIRTEM